MSEVKHLQCRLDTAEETISELQERATEVIKLKDTEKGKLRKNQQRRWPVGLSK